MAISFRIQYRDTSKATYHLPIITNHSFDQYWKPVATQLGLEWVLLIKSAGIPLVRHFDDLPTILDELQVLKDTLQTSHDPTLSEIIRLDRIEVIIQELNAIRDKPDTITEAFLG